MDEDEREQACAPAPVPAGMADQLAGYSWARDKVGQSGGAVYRLHSKTGAPELYLKTGRDRVADDIGDEMVRLGWLAGRMPVPSVLHFVRTADQAWLLTTAMPGKTAYQMMLAYPDRRLAIVDALARCLKRLHAIPPSACPYTSDHAYRLALARARIDARLVDEGDFDDDRQGWTANQVWSALQDLLPLAPDPVVTHGDFSLDNLLMRDTEVVACIDTARVGIADRYQDLAIAWNCLDEFGAPLQQRLLRQYGIGQPDGRKLQFFAMLDELF